MKKLLAYFPLSLSTKDLKSLWITIVIYIAVPAVFALISLLFSGVILLGLVMKLISILFALYCFIGIIITILKVTGVIKV